VELLLLAGLAYVAALVFESYFQKETGEQFWLKALLPALLTAFFGCLLGASEIISRYRDEPLKAVFNVYGATYLVTNASVSLAAFMLLARYHDKLLPAAIRHEDGILMAFFAGFGAMIVLRSKLFLYHSIDGKEIPIGPDLVADRLLKVIDRKIDRQRAAAREQLVFDLMRKYTRFGVTSEFFQISLGSFQNLSDEEKVEYKEKAERLAQLPLFEALKIMALGFLFLDLSGEANLRDVCAILDQRLAELPAAPPTS